MSLEPRFPATAPWAAMDALPVRPPYTAADVQAIADVLSLPTMRLLTVYVPRPGVRVIMGEPWYPVRFEVTLCPLADALQDSARLYLAHLRSPGRPSRRPSRKRLTRVARAAERRTRRPFAQALEELQWADIEALIREDRSPLTALERLARIQAQARTPNAETDVALTWLGGLVASALSTLERGRVASALSTLKPDPGGRPPDIALHQFLKHLCMVYQWATGKSPRLSRDRAGRPTGPLFRFLRTCLTRLTPQAPAMARWGEAGHAEALRGQIRRVLAGAQTPPRQTHSP
jgi:hypothetical protein